MNIGRAVRAGRVKKKKTRMWADDVMAAVANIGGLCSTPQSLADARCWSAVQ